MLYTVVGNGSGETAYEARCIRISEQVSEDDVQRWADEWKKDLSQDKTDIFEDMDTSVVGIEEIVDAMPPEWNAKLTDEHARVVFL